MRTFRASVHTGPFPVTQAFYAQKLAPLGPLNLINGTEQIIFDVTANDIADDVDIRIVVEDLLGFKPLSMTVMESR